MLEYRLYMLNPSGHIVDAEVLDCTNDVQAIRRASEAAAVRDVELWRGERKIRYIKRLDEDA